MSGAGIPPLHKSPLGGPSPSPKRQKLDSAPLDSASSAAAAASSTAVDDGDSSSSSSSSTLAARVAAFVNGDGRRPRSDTLCSHKSEYDEKAAVYDSYRGASPGWAVMSPLLTGAGTAGTTAEHGGENHGGLAGKRVLDLGCGTGGFFGKLLSKGPASLTAYDVSESMIEKAKAKAKAFGAPGGEYAHIPIDVRCANTADLAAGSFDAIVCLQVLQNICPGPAEGRGEAARLSFMQEMRRLLVPGGSVMITTRYRKQPHDVAAEEEEGEEEGGGGAAAAAGSSSSSSTYGDLYWYADRAVLPRAVAFMEGAVPARPAQELANAGFEGCALHNSTDTMIRADAYFRGEILAGAGAGEGGDGEKEAKAFQAADSFFSRLDGEEQAALRAHVAGLRARGELEAYVARRDRRRGKLGQVAVVVGRKPLL
jgi:2-polyprenyl-3-methyl-5-hydroxy-6-metoxy-1,4-benzoquinol methylase